MMNNDIPKDYDHKNEGKWQDNGRKIKYINLPVMKPNPVTS